MNQFDGMAPEVIALMLFQSDVFSNYPFILEARIISLSDDVFVYTPKQNKGKVSVLKAPQTADGVRSFETASSKIEEYYSRKKGVVIGDIDMLAKVEQCVGMNLLNDGSFVRKYERLHEFELPVQLLVTGDYHDPRFAVCLAN